MKVQDIMTTDVITVRDTHEIEEAARLLARYHISGVPVLDENERVVGLLTELDLISKKGTLVRDVMTRGLISVTPDTEVETVGELIANRRIRRVPVMQGNRLVGIVSRADLVRQIAMRWVCHTCGERVFSRQAPERCPQCSASAEAFSQLREQPGM